MKILSGYRNNMLFAFLIFVMISASGCFYLIVGGAAAAGGYAISRDTIQGETDRSFDEVWDAALINSDRHEQYFFVGNMFRHRSSFLIISVLRLPSGPVSTPLVPFKKVTK